VNILEAFTGVVTKASLTTRQFDELEQDICYQPSSPTTTTTTATAPGPSSRRTLLVKCKSASVSLKCLCIRPPANDDDFNVHDLLYEQKSISNIKSHHNNNNGSNNTKGNILPVSNHTNDVAMLESID
jgi:hypothetical protein